MFSRAPALIVLGGNEREDREDAEGDGDRMSALDSIDSFLFSISGAFCSPLAVFIQIQVRVAPIFPSCIVQSAGMLQIDPVSLYFGRRIGFRGQGRMLSLSLRLEMVIRDNHGDSAFLKFRRA